MTRLKYPPKTDILFKLFFTKNRHLLHSFVAAALQIPREAISSIVVTNPEILPDFASGKTCRVDLRLTVDAQIVDMEIQVENEHNFRERALVYWSRLLGEALKSGDDYKSIPRVVLISIVDFKLFDCAEYRSEFRALEKTRHEELTDKFAINFFELPKAPKVLDDGDSMIPWLQLFRAETEEELEAVAAKGGKEMTEAVEQMRYLAGSPEFLHLETLREMARLDEGQKLSNAEERGEKRGALNVLELLEAGHSPDEIRRMYSGN